jgi:multiple sugar transport system permease protein
MSRRGARRARAAGPLARSRRAGGAGAGARPLLTRWGPYLTLAPALALLGGIFLAALAYTVGLSLTSWLLLRPELPRAFVGLRNFQDLVTDPRVWTALRNTLTFALPAVALEFLAGLSLALPLQREPRGAAFFKSVLLIPLMVAPVVTGFTWAFMLHLDFGPLPQLLRALGLATLGGTPVLASRALVMPALILVDAWISTPFMMLVLLAGLQAIPPEPYEAAAVDGASALQRFLLITLPLLRPAVLVALLIRTINAVNFFDVAFIMTGGGPGTASEVLALFNYRVTFGDFDLGYGAAVSLFVLLVSATISLSYIRTLQRAR